MAPLNDIVNRSSDRRLQAASHPSLILPRTAAKRALTLKNTGGIIIFVILILTAIGLLFCIVVGLLMVKNKIKMRNREKRMEATWPKNQQQYTALQDHDSNSQYQGIQELPPDNQVYDPVPFRNVELQADTTEVATVHQLDGYSAPPRTNSRPIELPTMSDNANAPTK